MISSSTSATLHHWRFVVGTRKQVEQFVQLSITNHHPTSFLAASLNDLAQSQKNHEVARWYKSIDYFTTDGIPLTWYMRLLTKKPSERIYGPALMSSVCARLSLHTPSLRNVFLGPSQYALRALQTWSHSTKNNLTVTGAYVVPYVGNVSELLRRVRQARPDVVWIGVGSPRQAYIASRLKSVLPHTTIICVGAAFELLTGLKPAAPYWMQAVGLEWCYRLLSEPKRLWRRYLIEIPSFLIRSLIRS